METKTPFLLGLLTAIPLAASACTSTAPSAVSTASPPAVSEAVSTANLPLLPTFTEDLMPFQLTSTAFTQGNPIPAVYTCTGRNISPPLAWSNAPAGTQSLALIVDDPDAPGGTWTHWVIYNIPSSEVGLTEDIQPLERLADGSLNGKNSWGKVGYGGPCPPSGTHRYFFKLYALDGLPSLSSGATSTQLVKLMQGHILASAELMGTYSK